MNFLAKIDSKRIDAAGDVNITAGALSITTDGSNKATLTESGSGDFEIHAADDLRLNADGHDIVLKGASNEFGRLANESQNFIIKNITADKDIIFRADDGAGSTETYFYIDGSASKNVSNKDLRIIDSKDLSLGSSDDMQLLHNGTNSYIQNYTGDLQINSHVNGGDILFRADDGTGSLTTYFYLNGDDTNTNFQKDALFPDSVKAKFGTSADLTIYHDGSHSYIQDVGTGDLKITTSGGAVRIDKGVSESIAAFIPDGAVELYYDNSKKLETTSGGVEVTGKVVTTEIESASTILLDAAADITIDAGGQDIILSQDATIFGTISNSSGLQIRSRVNDADMFLRGVDGGVEFNALQLDMSSEGDAYFNRNIALNGKMVFNNNQELRWEDSSGTERTVLELDSSNNCYLGTSAGGNLYLVNGSSYTTAVTIDSSQNATFAGDITSGNISINKSTNPNIQLYRESATTQLWELSIDSSGRLLFQEAASSGGTQYTRLQIDDTGEVDIYNTLTATGNVTAPAFYISGGTGSNYIDVISNDLYIVAAEKNIIYSGNQETIRLETTGQVEFDKYGAQTFTGTSASYLIATSAGDIIEKTPAQVRSDIGAGTGSGSVTSVAVTVGTGLDVSGSPITSSGTIDIDLDLSELTSATGAMGSSDNFVLSTSGGNNRKSTPNLIGLSLFNNDSGFTTNTGTVTGTGSSGRIALWNSSTGLTSDSDLAWNSSTNKLIFADNSGYSLKNNSGVFEFNTDQDDTSTKINGFGGTGSLTIGEGTIFTAGSGFYVPSGYGISAGTTATASGTIRATGNIVAYYSDEKLKDFKGTIPNALDKVCKLNGYYYTQNEKAAELGYENYERQVGVSAQEVEKVMPEVVETAPISYNNDEDYLTVDYGRLVPLLIESIKELKNEIEILKNKSCGN